MRQGFCRRRPGTILSGMGARYLREVLTPDVLAAQQRTYGRTYAVPTAEQAAEEPPLDDDAIAFLAARDSVYLATVTSDGWPYLQHRGGPPGFLRAVGPSTIAFEDKKGNRQLVTLGNLATNDRIALIAIDYPSRTRLKLRGHARVVESAGKRTIEIDVVATDWNCPAYITPRYTAEEIRALAAGGAL